MALPPEIHTVYASRGPTLISVNPPSICAVIPTHNRPAALARAIRSVADQAIPASEIVVVDDTSTPPVDPTQLARICHSVTVIRSDVPLGPAGAKNAGVAAATSDFVAFLDDDDTWLPSKLDAVHRCIERHPEADVLIHQTSNPGEYGPQGHGCASIADPLSRMIRSQPPHLDGVVVRRERHLEHPFDPTMIAAEDIDYLINLARSGTHMVESETVHATIGGGDPSTISIDTRIAGRLSLLERHPEISRDTRALAFFYVRLGHLQRRAHRRSDAARSFATALRIHPRSAEAWRGLARSLTVR